MSHRTLANCLKDTGTPTVNLETININMAAQPGYYSRSDSVPTTTSSENGNKVSNPPLMGNPL